MAFCLLWHDPFQVSMNGGLQEFETQVIMGYKSWDCGGKFSIHDVSIRVL